MPTSASRVQFQPGPHGNLDGVRNGFPSTSCQFAQGHEICVTAHGVFNHYYCAPIVLPSFFSWWPRLHVCVCVGVGTTSHVHTHFKLEIQVLMRFWPPLLGLGQSMDVPMLPWQTVFLDDHI